MFTVDELRKLINDERTDIFYNSYYWRKLADDVKRENHNECMICRKNGKYSHADIVHHVKHLKKYPELAYSRFYIDENGKKQIQLMPVCINCHNDIHDIQIRFYRKSRFVNEERW